MKSKRTISIISILVLALIAGAVYGALKVNKAGEYENWKIYRNEDFGFEIRYPLECSYIQKQEKNNNVKAATFEQKNEVHSVLFGDQWTHKFSIAVYENLNNEDLKDFASKIIVGNGDIYNLNSINWTSTEINDHQALKADYENKIGGYNGIVSSIFIEKDGMIYRFFLFSDFILEGKNQIYEYLYEIII